MRTAITLGFKENGSAEIISGPDVAIDEQHRAFTGLAAGKSKFTEIQIWESDGGMRRSQRFGSKGTVDFNSAHLVEKQQAKGKDKERLPDLNPVPGKGAGVDFNAAHPVHLQQDKKSSKHLPDLNELRDQGATGKKSGVNWNAVKPVDEQDKPARSKKSAKKSSRKSAKKSSFTPSTSTAPAKDETPGEGDPTL